MMNFNYFMHFPQLSTLKEETLLNNAQYSIINTTTLKKGSKQLFPYFLLNSQIKENGRVELIAESSNSRMNLTKLQVLNQLGFRSYYNYVSQRICGERIYNFSSGIIQDDNYNTLMCYCVDLSKIDFVKKTNIPLDAFYLLINNRLLALPENKKIASILNSKDSVIEHALLSGIDVIYTHNIDNKIFDTVDIAFKSISDRKKYFQEKIQQIQKDIKEITPEEIAESILDYVEV